MRCGLCGTEINPGYYKCSRCGATYQKTASLLAGILLAVPAVLLFIFGFFTTVYGLLDKLEPLSRQHHAPFVPLGIILIAAGAVLWRLMRKTAPYKWVEETKIYPR